MLNSNEFKPDAPNEIPVNHASGNSILILDDEEVGRIRLRLVCKAIDSKHSPRILESDTISQALSVLSTTPINVLLLDKNLGKDNGINAIPELLQIQPHLKVIVVTGSRSTKDIVSAIRYGAFDYVTKDTEDPVIVAQIVKALEFSRFTLEKARLERSRKTEEGVPDLVGRSQAVIQLRTRLEAVAASDLPVLLEGESGVGKTTAASYLHHLRNQFLKDKTRPFFEVNIAALSPGLVEAELFGSEKGAFTGAIATKQGFVELADGGTLFIDEVGEISLKIQKKLLTVLQKGTYYRVGGKQSLRSAFKLICATNRDLKEMVRQGKFRHDLYNRISTFPIFVPSLKERREDIPHLIRHLLPKLCRDNRVFASYEDLPKEFIEEMKKHPPEANIKGLEHEISRLLVLAPKDRQGRPLMKDWHLYTRVRPGTVFHGEAITLQEVLNLPFDVVNAGFPGFVSFMETIAKKVFEDASRKFRKNREIAKALKLTDAAVSVRLKQLRLATADSVRLEAQTDDERIQIGLN